jgi:chromosomal replication initiation ATPase DnaA
MNNKDQILFNFKLNKNYLDQDYYLSSSNQEAYNLINCWPRWIKKTINLYGEKFSGKSHLASIFEKKTACIKVYSEKFSDETIQNFKIKQAIIIEDLDENFSENLLYTVLNIIEQENKYLLITSLKPLNKFNFKLPDLISRIRNCLIIGIKNPDDNLIYALLIKYLSDRQINIDKKLIEYIIKRIDRSYEKIFLFIHKVDKLSLKKGKPVDLATIKEALKK